MNNEKIAEYIINSMGSQLDLIFTLSVAICGGIIALTVQLVIKGKDAQVLKLNPCSRWTIIVLMILVLLTEGVSIFLGYLCRGAITSSIPIIFKQDFSKINHWEYADFEGCSTLMGLFEWQFLTFFIGIFLLAILVAILLIKNRKNI